MQCSMHMHITRAPNEMSEATGMMSSGPRCLQAKTTGGHTNEENEHVEQPGNCAYAKRIAAILRHMHTTHVIVNHRIPVLKRYRSSPS